MGTNVVLMICGATMIVILNYFIGTVLMNVLSILISVFMAHTIRTTRLQSLPAMFQFQSISKVQTAMVFKAVVLVIYAALLIYPLTIVVKYIQSVSRNSYPVDTSDTRWLALTISWLVLGFLSIAVDMLGNCSTS